MGEVSQQDREAVRSRLVEAAEFIRKRYGLPISEIKELLREMLEVSV